MNLTPSSLPCMLPARFDQLDDMQSLQQRLQTAEKYLAIQCQLSQLLAEVDCLDQAIETALRLLCEGFEWRFGEYWTLSQETQRLTRHCLWGLAEETMTIDPGTAIEFAYGVGLPGQIWAKNALTHFENLKQNPNFLRHDFAQRLNLQQGYGLPVCDREQLVGVITFLTQNDRPLDHDLRALLKVLGEQLGIFIQRKSAEIRLRQYAFRLENTLTELHQTQAQLLHREKMSSLGQLVAGIAHEINNPINFIHGNLKPAQNYYQDCFDLLKLYELTYPHPDPTITQKREEIDIDFLEDDFPKLLRSMKVGTERIREIMVSLRSFSRLDEAEQKTVNIHDGIESTLMLLHHRLKIKSKTPDTSSIEFIQVLKQYGDLPQVQCYPGQFNQVFLHLLTNAIDALESMAEDRIADATKTEPNVVIQPQITIQTEPFTNNDVTWIRITIADNGPGIPADLKSKIFNPFFTTKEVGQGKGLGLSLSYKLITETHQGQFYHRSLDNQGCAFVIEIPAEQENWEVRSEK